MENKTRMIIKKIRLSFGCQVQILLELNLITSITTCQFVCSHFIWKLVTTTMEKLMNQNLLDREIFL